MTEQTNGGVPADRIPDASKAFATPSSPATPMIKKQSKEDLEFQRRQREIQLDKAESVAIQKTTIFDPIAYAQLKQLAVDLIAGGATSPDAKTPEQLMVKLQAGYELGMSPVQSQNSLYIVNGRVTIWGAALIARLRLFGWKVKFVDESQEQCTIQLTKINRGGETVDECEDTFLYQDAVDSGYTAQNDGKEKIGWKKGQNRKLKLRYGAAAQAVKTQLPEVLAGAGNIGITEIDMDAPVIEGDYTQSNGKLTSDERRARMLAAETKRRELDNGHRPVAVEADK